MRKKLLLKQERDDIKMKELLYKYFQDSISKKRLDWEVIDEIFFKNIPDKDLEKIYKFLNLDSNNPYVTSIFQEKIDILKSLTDKDMYS